MPPILPHLVFHTKLKKHPKGLHAPDVSVLSNPEPGPGLQLSPKQAQKELGSKAAAPSASAREPRGPGGRAAGSAPGRLPCSPSLAAPPESGSRAGLRQAGSPGETSQSAARDLPGSAGIACAARRLRQTLSKALSSPSHYSSIIMLLQRISIFPTMGISSIMKRLY